MTLTQIKKELKSNEAFGTTVYYSQTGDTFTAELSYKSGFGDRNEIILGEYDTEAKAATRAAKIASSLMVENEGHLYDLDY